MGHLEENRISAACVEISSRSHLSTSYILDVCADTHVECREDRCSHCDDGPVNFRALAFLTSIPLPLRSRALSLFQPAAMIGKSTMSP